MDEREMYDQIGALIGAVAKAFDVSDMEIITAVEQGRMAMEMMADAEGRNFVRAAYDDRSADIYADAIFRPDDVAEDEEGCGGGCSCEH